MVNTQCSSSQNTELSDQHTKANWKIWCCANWKITIFENGKSTISMGHVKKKSELVKLPEGKWNAWDCGMPTKWMRKDRPISWLWPPNHWMSGGESGHQQICQGAKGFQSITHHISHSCDDISTHLESTVAGAFYQLLINQNQPSWGNQKTPTPVINGVK